jgi:chromosome segregation ATPase
MVPQIRYEPTFHAAMAHIFQRCLVVRSIDVGARHARTTLLECVTLDGDRVSGSGVLTGGYVDATANRLHAWHASKRADELCAVQSNEAAAARAQLDQVRRHTRAHAPRPQSPHTTRQLSALPPTVADC